MPQTLHRTLPHETLLALHALHIHTFGASAPSTSYLSRLLSHPSTRYPITVRADTASWRALEEIHHTAEQAWHELAGAEYLEPFLELWKGFWVDDGDGNRLVEGEEGEKGAEKVDLKKAVVGKRMLASRRVWEGKVGFLITKEREVEIWGGGKRGRDGDHGLGVGVGTGSKSDLEFDASLRTEAGKAEQNATAETEPDPRDLKTSGEVTAEPAPSSYVSASVSLTLTATLTTPHETLTIPLTASDIRQEIECLQQVQRMASFLDGKGMRISLLELVEQLKR